MLATRQADRQMKNHGDKSAATLATENLSLSWAKSGKTPVCEDGIVDAQDEEVDVGGERCVSDWRRVMGECNSDHPLHMLPTICATASSC